MPNAGIGMFQSLRHLGTEDSITFLFARRLRMFYTLKIGNKNIRQFKEWVTALPGTPL